MKGRIWQYLVKFTIVGNAILFVVLLGGSDKSSAPQIYPHSPVDVVEDLTILKSDRYKDLLFDAHSAWDNVTGSHVIFYYSQSESATFDTLVVDAKLGDIIPVTFRQHTGDPVSFNFLFDCPSPEPCTITGTVISWYASDIGANWPLKVMVLNWQQYANFSDARILRGMMHEFGHVVGLADHDTEEDPENYNAIMDSTCCDHSNDFIIANSPDDPSFADEASCVRENFNLPGKQRCN